MICWLLLQIILEISVAEREQKTIFCFCRIKRWLVGGFAYGHSRTQVCLICLLFPLGSGIPCHSVNGWEKKAWRTYTCFGHKIQTQKSIHILSGKMSHMTLTMQTQLKPQPNQISPSPEFCLIESKHKEKHSELCLENLSPRSLISFMLKLKPRNIHYMYQNTKVSGSRFSCEPLTLSAMLPSIMFP